MPVSFVLSDSVPAEVDAIGVGVAADRLGEGDLPWDSLAAQGFEGKRDQVAVLAGTAGGVDTVVVGVGPSQDVDGEAIRRAAACLTRACGRREAIATHLLDLAPPGSDREVLAQALAEGASLGTYRFDRYKSEPGPDALREVTVVNDGGTPVAEALELGARIAEGVAFARDLVNLPGGELTPAALAQAAVEVAERENLQITVMDRDDIVEAGLGGILGVNRGSTNPPRFIELGYEPANPRGSLALVGKGITFDSGGLSIKSGEGMMTMKMDMGGAAAVLGAFSVLRAVAPGCRVRGYIPTTDNMTGGDATRPGDVLEIRNGKTVEVLNTDAEGRLILADALSLASESQPDAIVDLATLTGAVEVALGPSIAGLMGNRTSWIDQVRDAADRAGERVWELPLPDDYRSQLDSDVADLRNISKDKKAGTITAALFLREFVGEGIAWAHLDIAGTAWWGEGDRAQFGRGATGWGVRTLVELVRTFTPPA
jgi:leucyl aminopeptidase